MKITKFFGSDFVNYASYSNLRAIASYIDGQKNTSRKILYTIIEKNIKEEIKVSQLNSKVAEFTEYLHGDMSSVIVTMAENYVGTNNVPLLAAEGNFGTRFVDEASAPRYIYTFGKDILWQLFNKDDSHVLVNQYFEGTQIEPRFYVPALPLILLNGSSGPSTGFAQKILPRNPKKIKQYIEDYLNNKLKPTKENSLEPYYEGFKGSITPGNNSKQWVIRGSITKSTTKVTIDELPIGYNLKSYLKVLDSLEDNKKINKYTDLSNSVFKFDVSMNSSDIKKLSDDDLMDRLKLTKTVTENITCIDEENKIVVFENIRDLLDAFIVVKLKYIQKRKDYIIQRLEEAISIDYSKYLFIKSIVDGSLIINNRKKSDIVIDISKIDGIVERENSYDYLLNMNIMSLTEERLNKLFESVESLKKELEVTISTSVNEMWLNDLKNIKV